MPALKNPAIAAFLESMETESVFGQIIVRRSSPAFELCHVADRESSGLEPVSPANLRQWVQTNSAGQFRPLKSAPNLRRGWITKVDGAEALAAALEVVYPGALADWWTALDASCAPIGFREFAERQTGMYRITAMLSDEQAGRVARACCAPSLCLKRRRWSVPGLETSRPATRGELACLEPCALFLEFARKAMRIEQEEGTNLVVAPSDLATIRAALTAAAAAGVAREGDVASPDNPRRALLVLAKLGEVPVLSAGDHE